MTFVALDEIYGACAVVARRCGRTCPAATKLSPGATWALYCVRATSIPVDARLRAAGEAHRQGVAARSSQLHDGPIAILPPRPRARPLEAEPAGAGPFGR